MVTEICERRPMEKRKRICISLNDTELNQIEIESKKQGLKKSTFIKSVLIKYINKKTKTK